MDIKKTVVRSPKTHDGRMGHYLKSILCLDFFPVSLSEEADRAEQYQHAIAQNQADDTHNQT